MMNQMQWPMRLADYAYAQSLLIGWQIADHSKDTNWVYFEAALERYLQSQDHKQPLAARYHALLDSRDQFKNLFALCLHGLPQVYTKFTQSLQTNRRFFWGKQPVGKSVNLVRTYVNFK